MTPGSLIISFAERGIRVELAGDYVKLSATKGAVTHDDKSAIRDQKQGVIRILRLVEGLPVNAEANILLSKDEVDPEKIPACESCGGLCDVQTLDDEWHCNLCDPEAGERRLRTERYLRTIAVIRYIHDCRS